MCISMIYVSIDVNSNTMRTLAFFVFVRGFPLFVFLLSCLVAQVHGVVIGFLIAVSVGDGGTAVEGRVAVEPGPTLAQPSQPQ